MARVCSGTILNGCGSFSFDYKQAFSTAVNLDVYVNNVRFCNVTSPGGSNDTANVHNSGSIPVNIPGNFVIEFVQADSTNSGQVTIDNVEWTCDTALPEPSNYPTDLTATPGILKSHSTGQMQRVDRYQHLTLLKQAIRMTSRRLWMATLCLMLQTWVTGGLH